MQTNTIFPSERRGQLIFNHAIINLQRINLKGNSPTKTISFQHVLLMDLSIWPSRPVLGHSGTTSGFWPRQSLGFKNPDSNSLFYHRSVFCFFPKRWLSFRDPIWSNYSDLTRPHPKWWFSKGNLFFQENLGW